MICIAVGERYCFTWSRWLRDEFQGFFVVSTRNLSEQPVDFAGQELTFDYSTQKLDGAKNGGVCLCGSSKCRLVVGVCLFLFCHGFCIGLEQIQKGKLCPSLEIDC